MASVTHDVVHEAPAERARVVQPYMNPYLAGIGLGLVLLAAVGQGLAAYPAETFHDEGVARLLGLPEGEYPGVVVVLGR